MRHRSSKSHIIVSLTGLRLDLQFIASEQTGKLVAGQTGRNTAKTFPLRNRAIVPQVLDVSRQVRITVERVQTDGL